MSFSVEPINATLGARVRGVDLGKLDDVTFDALYEVFLEYGVLVFPAQHLSDEAQDKFARRFGEIERTSPGQKGAITRITNESPKGGVFSEHEYRYKALRGNEGWHTDSSFREIPASFSVFSCVVGPEVGGDTFYANLRRGWVDLPEDLKARLYGLRGVHDYGAAYRARGNDEGGMIGYDLPAIVHPLVRRHPETGTTGLYVSEHISHIEGMDPAESHRLLDQLLTHTTAENRVYRHHWSVGDVMIWDNRSMLHRAQGFDQRHPRVMHHVRVGGFERPIAAT